MQIFGTSLQVINYKIPYSEKKTEFLVLLIYLLVQIVLNLVEVPLAWKLPKFVCGI